MLWSYLSFQWSVDQWRFRWYIPFYHYQYILAKMSLRFYTVHINLSYPCHFNKVVFFQSTFWKTFLLSKVLEISAPSIQEWMKMVWVSKVLNIRMRAGYSCNKITTTWIQIFCQNWNGLFSNISHQMMIYGLWFLASKQVV